MKSATEVEENAVLLGRIVNYLGRSGAIDGLVEQGVAPTEISFTLGMGFDQCLQVIEAHCERPGRQRASDLFVDYGECNFALHRRACALYERMQSTGFMAGHRQEIVRIFARFVL